MGHPCCGIFRCRERLENNRNRFCKAHTAYHQICAIVGCEQPVISASKACNLQEHQEIEKKHTERSTGSFLYRTRLQHAEISHQIDSFSATQRVPEQDIEEDTEIYTTVNNTVQFRNEKNTGTIGVLDDTASGNSESTDTTQVQEPCPSKSANGNAKVTKAQFGRRRTHNEQTLVRPCGVIFARATMFGAEAVSNFLVMVKNAFSVPGAQKPEHIFYDTNCDARQQAEKDPWFSGVGMCVDAWHFRNKHAVTHTYCQLNCNPAKYPELLDDSGGWFFNTSIAEQTNAWMGGYHSICREMLPDKFNFFLDEMIRLRNIETIRRLNQQGHHSREL